MYFLSIYFENLHSLGYKCGKSVLDDISVDNALKTEWRIPIGELKQEALHSSKANHTTQQTWTS